MEARWRWLKHTRVEIHVIKFLNSNLGQKGVNTDRIYRVCELLQAENESVQHIYTKRILF